MNKLKISTVIIPVKGGLGNQMFFYAFSLYLKSFGFRPLLVWHEYIFTKQHHGVELFEAFDINNDKYSKWQISYFLILNNSSLPFIFKRLIGRLYRSKYTFIRHYKQSSPYNFDNVLERIIKGKIYMDGFWQNYQYLTSNKEIILNSFRFRIPKDFLQNSYLRKIVSCNSVSIHIRRGDYLDPVFKELNVIQSNDYYLRAIRYIEETCGDPVYFIFTDDMKWAKRSFSGENYIFVEGNDNSASYLDMYLMSQCKHNIIANSTFSWWGAWLNVNPSKIVIVPEKWTQDVVSSQICPSDWIMIEI